MFKKRKIEYSPNVKGPSMEHSSRLRAWLAKYLRWIKPNKKTDGEMFIMPDGTIIAHPSLRNKLEQMHRLDLRD